MGDIREWGPQGGGPGASGSRGTCASIMATGCLCSSLPTVDSPRDFSGARWRSMPVLDGPDRSLSGAMGCADEYPARVQLAGLILLVVRGVSGRSLAPHSPCGEDEPERDDGSQDHDDHKQGEYCVQGAHSDHPATRKISRIGSAGGDIPGTRPGDGLHLSWMDRRG